MRYIKLSNGIKMPILGFGTARLTGNECIDAVTTAIKCGYRLIDTADMYENEKEVGIAIKKSGVNREELFITSKLYSKCNTYELAKAQIEESLKKLDTSYIDLYLIHEPYDEAIEAYRALEDAYKLGLVKAIGISNFNKECIDKFINRVTIKPMLNQVECHPFYQELELKKYMDSLDIQMEGYAPFASSMLDIFNNNVLKNIAIKYNRSVYQVILNYLTGLGIIVISKASSYERIKDNLYSLDFKLDNDDISLIMSLEENKCLYGWNE